jgi:hypothetical protein
MGSMVSKGRGKFNGRGTDIMADITDSRRGFLFVILAMIQGVLFAGPRELRAAGRGAKDLVDRLEMEGLASSRPQRESWVSSGMVGEETTLYRGKSPLCSMNRTGKVIWESCDGRHSPRDICRLIVRRCRVDEARAERDVLLFLAELRKIRAIRA